MAISLPYHLRLNVFFLILLFLNWVIETDYKAKYHELRIDKFFLLSSCFFIWYLIEILFSSNFNDAWFSVEKKTAIIIVPMILLSKKILFNNIRSLFFTYLSYSVSIAVLICLTASSYTYLIDHNLNEFIYHNFAGHIGQSAIYFSLLCMISAGYLQLELANKVEMNNTIDYIRLLICSLGILLLASKMHIIFYLIFSLSILITKIIHKKLYLYSTLLLIAVLVLTILFTKNPIIKRFNDINIDRISLLSKEKYSPDVYLDGLTQRLLWIKFGTEILEENNAWLVGVSPGNSKELLNQKITNSNLYTGVKNTNDYGYLNLNYHNQFMETLVGTGLIGILLLILIILYLIYISHISKDWLILYGVLLFGICFLSESILERQIGVVSFSIYFALALTRKKDLIHGESISNV